MLIFVENVYCIVCLYAGDSMLVAMGDSDADSMSEASSDVSVPPPVNIDDNLAAGAPPDEMSEQNSSYRNDAKEKSEKHFQLI